MKLLEQKTVLCDAYKMALAIVSTFTEVEWFTDCSIPANTDRVFCLSPIKYSTVSRLLFEQQVLVLHVKRGVTIGGLLPGNIGGLRLRNLTAELVYSRIHDLKKQPELRLEELRLFVDKDLSPSVEVGLIQRGQLTKLKRICDQEHELDEDSRELVSRILGKIESHVLNSIEA